MKRLTKIVLLGLFIGILGWSGLWQGVVVAAGTATLSISPASGSVVQGNNLTVGIYEDSGTDQVNAVQANLSYPASQLSFVSIDASTSAFEINAEGSGGAGSVRIGRGTTTPVSGKQLVAYVTFSATASSGTAAVTFASGSGVVRSSDSSYETLTTVPGSYTLTAPTPPPSTPPPSSTTTTPTTTTKKTTSTPTTTTPSTSAPAATTPTPTQSSNPELTLSNVKANNVSASQATISWTTSVPASSEVSYGDKANVYSHNASSDTLVTKHSLTINIGFLQSGQALHFKVTSKDALSRVVVSPDTSFKIPLAKKTGSNHFWVALAVVVAVGVVAIAAAEFMRRMQQRQEPPTNHFPFDHLPFGHDHPSSPSAPAGPSAGVSPSIMPPVSPVAGHTVIHPTDSSPRPMAVLGHTATVAPSAPLAPSASGVISPSAPGSHPFHS